MQDLNKIKIKITEMSEMALKMWKVTHQAFMEHDLDLLSSVLKEEDKLNDLEKEISASLIELSRTPAKKFAESVAIVYLDIIGDLELIGDYCKDILERVQMKIEEKLLFSEEAVKEYNNLYQKTERALENVVRAVKENNFDAAKKALEDEKRIDSLVDKYRQRHDQRMIEGICSPLACNMFLNMLDFTGQVFHRTESIAKNLLKLK